MIVDEVAGAGARPVPAAELAKAKARARDRVLARPASSEGKAEHLGQFEFARGDYRGCSRAPTGIARVSAATCARGRALLRARRALGRGGAPKAETRACCGSSS